MIDLTDPDTFVHGPPLDYFAELRRSDPVHWHTQKNDEGFWVVTRHADVLAVSRDSELFSSARNTASAFETVPAERLTLLQQTLINMDPPQHTRLRTIVSRLFTPRGVGRLKSRIGQLTERILDDVIERGDCDFVGDIAMPLPLWVICEMLGVPESDWNMVVDTTNALVSPDDPEFAADAEVVVAKRAQFEEYARDLARTKRALGDHDDIISVLMRAEVEGEHLSDTEFSRFFVLLAAAGNETTRNAMTHSMLALFDQPDARAELAGTGVVPQSAVDELLRFASPVVRFGRVAQQDVVLGGREIAEGDKVVIYYISANRDEAVFENPERLDLRRSPNLHVTFGGGGVHFCIGAALARLEMSIMLGEIMRRLPDLAPSGPPEYVRSNLLHAVKHLPVTFTPGPRTSVPEG